MWETNVLGMMRVTRALLPALERSGDGIVVTVTSVAGHNVYEGGAGYAAAKHAERAVSETLRLEVFGKPIRVVEVAPGMVATEEFSLNRLGGDQARADAVYAGVPGPLTADDVADCIAWAATRPWNVNVDLLVVRPRAQAAQHKLYRETTHG
jgi:NADP-dependent 3-hydroxy acid dehydrogenase YdfG